MANFIPGYEDSPEFQDIQRQRKYADLLRQQAFDPMKGQMVGQTYVAPSITQGLAKLFQGYQAGQVERGANEKQKALADMLRGQRDEWINSMPQASEVQKFGGDGMGPPQVTTQRPSDQDYLSWAAKGMGIDPNLASAGFRMADSVAGREDRNASLKAAQEFRAQQAEADRAARAEQANANREQRTQEMKMRSEDMRLSQQERLAAQRQLAQMQIDARKDLATAFGGTGNKPPAGYRFKPNGDMEAIPGGPADAKTQAKAQQQAAGATDVDLALGTLRDAYDRLEKGGGITSTKNNPISNAGAWIASTGIGQTAGKAFGTDNQSARNDIAMTRPALLAALMKATGMSAKQMDSNVELKLWLATATDPSLDVESNRRALAKIEQKYITKSPEPVTQGPKPISSDADYDALPSGAEFIAPDGSHRRKP